VARVGDLVRSDLRPLPSGDAGSGSLVPAVLAGRADAIDAWFRAEHPVVYRLCFGFLAREADAEDAAQDAMLHLYDHLERWDCTRSYASWRTKVVVNLCRDRLRRRAARDRAERGAPGTAPERVTEDPVRSAEVREIRALLQEALAALSPREREAFVLRDLEAVPTAQVAGALGVTAGTVRSLLTLARRRLRRLLGARLAPELFGGAEEGP